MNSITLCNKVEIYKNLLPEASEFAKYLKQSESENSGKYFLKKWDQWSIFGTYTQEKNDNDNDYEYGEQYDKEKYICNSISEAYAKAIDHYIKKYNIVLPDGAGLMSSSFSKYDTSPPDIDDGLAMAYHTDYVEIEKDMPGPKFFLTCTTYLNDDYDGGDIIFYIDGDDRVYPYKPKAGDICVFPSGDSYFHAVKAITSGEKFFVRNFIYYIYDGSKSWLEDQKRYGAYRWSKMEEARIEKDYPSTIRRIDYDEKTNKIRRVL